MNAAEHLSRIENAARLTRAAQIADGGPRNRCIAHTRQLLAVLEAIGYKAHPVVVRAVLENAALVQLRRELNADPTIDYQRRLSETGGGSIEVGWGQAETHEWPAHLIVEVPALHCFIDVSADQSDDPALGFNIGGPFVFIAEPDEETIRPAPDGGAYPGFLVPMFDGGIVLYHLFRDDRSFEDASEWNDAFAERPENDLIRFLVSLL